MTGGGPPQPPAEPPAEPDPGSQTAENVCPHCAGTGRVQSETCPVCAGSGVVVEPVGDA